MQHICFIGMRACGKSTIGAFLAKQLNWTFEDLDKTIETQAGASIETIVRTHSWEYFRLLESQALQHSLQQNLHPNSNVCAPGGGIVLAEANRTFIHTNSLCFYLETTAEVLFNRLQSNNSKQLQTQRPALTSLPLLDEIKQTLEQRQKLYKATAHGTLDAQLSIETICQQVVSCLGKRA